jgi:predicted nucleotidyltransferase component of viral defense system
MLTKRDLIEVPIEFNLYQKEKDYLQHLILSRIYSKSGKSLVFKGGTALQKIFGLNRFSEDLDFTVEESVEIGKLEKGLSELKNFYPTTYERIQKNQSMTYKIKIEGPLYDDARSQQTVRVEISQREKILLEPLTEFVTPLYKDIGQYMLIVMNPKEILSEKIRALMTRSKARDLFDSYFLTLKGIRTDFSVINKKLEFYQIQFDPDHFKNRILKLKPQWERELSALVRVIPTFEAASETVFQAIDQINRE